MNTLRLISCRPLVNAIAKYGCSIISKPKSDKFTSIHGTFLHTTCANKGLMDFFDDKKNWGETEVKVGRSWRLDELRIKSNTDLHKLWYILLKEKNMLLTMETECKDKMRLFPNPERIDKVEESMNNIETVVRERNIAYHELETGTTGERPAEYTYNVLGVKHYYKMEEHLIPKFMNTKWAKSHIHSYGGYAVRKFIRFYNEKIYNEKRKLKNRNHNHVQHLLKRFPNIDMELLRRDYPDVDIEKAKRSKKARGHNEPIY